MGIHWTISSYLNFIILQWHRSQIHPFIQNIRLPPLFKYIVFSKLMNCSKRCSFHTSFRSLEMVCAQPRYCEVSVSVQLIPLSLNRAKGFSESLLNRLVVMFLGFLQLDVWGYSFSDKTCGVSIEFENAHQMFFSICFQLWCAAMSFSSPEKCFHAALFVAFRVFTSVRQNLICVNCFPVDVCFQLNTLCTATSRKGNRFSFPVSTVKRLPSNKLLKV